MIEFCSELAINVLHIDMQVMHEIYDYQRYHHLFGDVTFCAILYYLGHLVFLWSGGHFFFTYSIIIYCHYNQTSHNATEPRHATDAHVNTERWHG